MVLQTVPAYQVFSQPVFQAIESGISATQSGAALAARGWVLCLVVRTAYTVVV